MKNQESFTQIDALAEQAWLDVDRHYLASERDLLRPMLSALGEDYYAIDPVTQLALRLIEHARHEDRPPGAVQSLLDKYDLGTDEGVALMCLGEALLRIPDSSTLDRFIADSLSKGNWRELVTDQDSFFMHASAYAMFIGGKILNQKLNPDWPSILSRWFRQAGAPMIRGAVKEVMQLMGRQYILSEHIEDAVSVLSPSTTQVTPRYSFDMLGEAALSMSDAERYFEQYLAALRALSDYAHSDNIWHNPGLSIKLSALEPRFDPYQVERVEARLLDKLTGLLQLAAQANIGVSIDAEESELLYFTQRLFRKLYFSKQLRDYAGLGMVLQTYQKRAPALLQWLLQLSTQGGKPIAVRLVKGAYWDNEIKHAQKLGLQGYPVYSKKEHTDVSFLYCLNKLFDSPAFYPQIATHNAMSAAAAIVLAQQKRVSEWELQRLHGMGESLYQAIAQDVPEVAIRTYAPIGGYKDLLPYLVRRMLENGANNSFVNRFKNKRLPTRYLTQDPCRLATEGELTSHHRIVLPQDIYQPHRFNATRPNLYSLNERQKWQNALSGFSAKTWQIASAEHSVSRHSLYRAEALGQVALLDSDQLEQVLQNARQAKHAWQQTDLQQRVQMVSAFAQLVQMNRTELVYLIVREAGRCVLDALSELQEAVDFCHYYSAQAKHLMADALSLDAIVGETNTLYYQGRGIFLCISPWNFPVAIFCGQIIAALLTGNVVIAKSASATPIIAARLAQLFHQAGIPDHVLQQINASATLVEHSLIASADIDGIAFTGSVATARKINQRLAERQGPIAKFVAETGGLNAMLADSSALPEQLVKDVIISACNSAGQRCSALRLLVLQEDIAETIVNLLIGALNELQLGDPLLLTTDMGPLIDKQALTHAEQHVSSFPKQQILYRYPLPEQEAGKGLFAPALIELQSINELPEEVFAPIIHVYRYRSDQLSATLQEINNLGYGLTLGLHSRLDSNITQVTTQAKVGNIYINRDMIGASVGAQPFGGQGLSGTGPKAGGPNYLSAFVIEKVVTTNTSAVGGNVSLLVESDDKDCKR